MGVSTCTEVLPSSDRVPYGRVVISQKRFRGLIGRHTAHYPQLARLGFAPPLPLRSNDGLNQA